MTTRRNLLIGLGAAGASAWAGAATARRSALPSNPDVVVIGAGSAGIAAATALMAAGREVVVLEAMDRVGGRAFTDTTTFGSPFDVGCAWLHKSDDNPYTPYAEANGFTLADHEYDLEKLYLQGRWGDAAALNHAEEALLEAIGEEERDVAASTVPFGSTPLDEAAGDYLGALDMAVDLDELSTTDYNNADDLSPNKLCREGFGSIVAHRARGLPIRLSTPVRAVRYDGSGVVVSTDAGVLNARAVVVTCSTGVLADGVIRFTPELPVTTQQAIADIPMGMLAKIPLQITGGERFGLKAFDDLMLARRGRRDLYFLSFPFDTDVLVGFVGGDLGWQLSAAGEAAAIDFATEGLVEMFGSDARSKVGKGMLTPWASNPWTRGAYAAAWPGRYSARADLAQPVADRIFFAGEALAEGLIQTCGGAWKSGEKTAGDLLSRIRFA